jgi:hypothetical protein
LQGRVARQDGYYQYGRMDEVDFFHICGFGGIIFPSCHPR